MFKDYCPECGHILSKNGTLCCFCGWSEHIDFIDAEAVNVIKDNALIYSLPNDFHLDQASRV